MIIYYARLINNDDMPDNCSKVILLFIKSIRFDFVTLMFLCPSLHSISPMFLFNQSQATILLVLRFRFHWAKDMSCKGSRKSKLGIDVFDWI